MLLINRLIDYIKSSRLELKYVNWPSRKNTIRFTLLVIAVSAIITIFLGSLDILFQFILEKFIIKAI